MPDYLRPHSLDRAVAMLSERRATILSGGTDFYPARAYRPVSEDVLDIAGIAELRGISEQADHWRLGAATTWTDILRADLPPWFRCLRLAAAEVGGIQIQNTGTIAGNICNASPAADGVPALMALGASVELASASGTRTMALEHFITGVRRTECRADELVSAVLVPKWSERARSGFLKLGSRKYLVISIVMVAGIVDRDGAGRIAKSGFAIGACSPVARRLGGLEQALQGRACGGEFDGLVTLDEPGVLSPIDDVRGTAAYRRDAATTLVRRLVSELAS